MSSSSDPRYERWFSWAMDNLGGDVGASHAAAQAALQALDRGRSNDSAAASAREAYGGQPKRTPDLPGRPPQAAANQRGPLMQVSIGTAIKLGFWGAFGFWLFSFVLWAAFLLLFGSIIAALLHH